MVSVYEQQVMNQKITRVLQGKRDKKSPIFYLPAPPEVVQAVQAVQTPKSLQTQGALKSLQALNEL